MVSTRSRLKPGSIDCRLRVAAQQQASSSQQHRRERHLGDDEPLAQAQRARAGARATPTDSRSTDSGRVTEARSAGTDADGEPGEPREDGRVANDTAGHRHVEAERANVLGYERARRGQAHRREQGADDHAGERHDEVSSSRLRTIALRLAPSDDADGDVALAFGGAREPDVGEVHAGDEEHDRGGGEQQQARRALFAREREIERHRRSLQPWYSGIWLAELARRPRGEGRELRVELREVAVGRDPRDDRELTSIAPRSRPGSSVSGSHRSVPASSRPARHDADDGGVGAVDAEPVVRRARDRRRSD